MTSGINSRMGWDWQRMLIKRALLTCKHALDGLPTELKLTFGTGTSFVPGAQYANFGASDKASSAEVYHENATSAPGQLNRDRRQKQYEIQKANLYVSQLGSRSHIIEKYWALCEYDQQQSTWAPSPDASSSRGVKAPSSPPPSTDGFERSPGNPEQISFLAMTGAAPQQLPSSSVNRSKEQERAEMAEEREDIIRDLLKVLSSISQVNMEPNGGSLVSHPVKRDLLLPAWKRKVPLTLYPVQMFKIRMIASTLLDVPRTRKGALALQADEYLARFLDILVKLERAMPVARASRQKPAEDSNADVQSSLGSTNAPTVEADEEAELMHWADLGEYQERFIKSGGFLG